MIAIDYLTVLVAGLVGFIISYVWFSSFLFGPIIKKKMKNSYARKWLSYIFNFIVIFVVSLFLALMESYLGVTSFWDGVISGVIIWIGLVMPMQLFSVLSKRTKKTFFIIETTFWLICLIVMGGILAG